MDTVLIRKLLFHLIFWVFSFLYIWDYFIEVFTIWETFVYASFEIGVLSFEFYINLFLLIPFVLKKKGYLIYFICSITLLLIGHTAYVVTGFDEVLLSENYLRSMYTFFLNHGFFMFISFSLSYVLAYTEKREESLLLEKDKLQLELNLLKGQIAPHFLFNTLNNIYALAVMKSDNAPVMIDYTAKILRHYAYTSQQDVISLRVEIDAVLDFLELQKFRELPGGNNVRLEIEGDLNLNETPPLLLMTLVENTFKHGDIITAEDGFVNILIVSDTERIKFEIKNSYSFKGREKGIGLENLQKQLKNLFNDTYDFQIKDNGGVFTVILEVYVTR